MEPSSECVDFVAMVADGGEWAAAAWTARLDGERHLATSRTALWKRVETRVTELVKAQRRSKKSKVHVAGLELWVSEDGASVARCPDCSVRTWYVRAHVHGHDVRGRPRAVFHHHPAVRLLDEDLEHFAL